jgi:hypothetical protein
MDSLLAILATPAAASGAVAALSAAVDAVARPFADVLATLTQHPDQPAGTEEADLHERIAERLQSILEAAGAAPGDCASLSYDAATGRVDIDQCASILEDDVAASIEADEQLIGDLAQLAAIDAAVDGRVELLVQIA